MIIDDFELIRDAWTLILQTDGRFEVIDKIGNSAKVEAHIKKKHPDLVLLDINMAPLDGFEVLAIIRKEAPSTKVIAVSLHRQTVYVKKMMKEGANGYVTKNSSAQELIHAIDVVMKGDRYICKEIKNSMAEQALNIETPGVRKLTTRELEVIRFLKQGLSSKQMAEKLGVTVKTIEVHRHNILKKLNVSNSIAAVEVAKAQGLRTYAQLKSETSIEANCL